MKNQSQLPISKVVFFEWKNSKYLTSNGVEITTEFLLQHEHSIFDNGGYLILKDDENQENDSLIGKKFYDYKGTKNHIASIFNDGEEKIVVYKYWLKRRLRWQYISEPLRLLMLDFNREKWGNNKWI